MRLLSFSLLGLIACASAPPPKATPSPIPPATEEELQLNVEFLDPASILSANFDAEEFLAWSKAASDSLRTEVAKTGRTPRDVVALFVFTPGKPAHVAVGARPPLDPEVIRHLQQLLAGLRAPKAELVDFGLTLHVAVGGGLENKDRLVPALVDPRPDEEQLFEEAGPKERALMLRAWARQRVLPVMGAMSDSIGPSFPGVKAALGRAGTVGDAPIDLPALTHHSADYWRAVLEMARGNQMIPLIWIGALVAEGRLDYAHRLLQMVWYFSDPESGFAHDHLATLRSRLEVFRKPIDERMARGSEQHGAGNYDAAIETFESILAD